MQFVMISMRCYLKYSFLWAQGGWVGLNLASESKIVTKSSQLLGILTQSINFCIMQKLILQIVQSALCVTVFQTWFVISIINICKIEMKQKSNRDHVKVRFILEGKTKNKVLNCKGLDYGKFAEKVTNNLELDKQKYYKLYYIDEDQDKIIVNASQDYDNFIQNAEPLILCIEQSKDPQIDFRKLQKKPANQEQVQNLREELKSKEIELHQLQNKCKSIKNFKEIIEKKREQMIKQLEQFKNDLEARTTQTLLERLKEIHKNQKLRTGNFQHKVRCQSSIECSSKDNYIVGLRFTCIVCSADLCQQCADQQFKGRNYCHEPTHPMLKVRNDKWQKKLLIQLKQSSLKASRTITSQTIPVRSDQNHKIKALKEVMLWSEEKARKFLYDNLHLNEDQLIERASST